MESIGRYPKTLLATQRDEEKYRQGSWKVGWKVFLSEGPPRDNTQVFAGLGKVEGAKESSAKCLKILLVMQKDREK
jgi:hypothetical protein